MIKTWIRRIHLVLAILSGIILINLSISGVLLLYAKDIQAFINPSHWRIQLSADQSPPLKLSKLVEKIEQTTDSKVKFIQQQEMLDDAWLVSLKSGKYLNINPYTGEILHQHYYYDTLYGFLMSLHRWMLYKTDSNEKPLKVWVSIASLILIIEIILGCTLWLRAKNSLKRLKINWKSKPKVFYYQLHTTLGVFTCIPLILIAFSGMAFHWQPAAKQVVEWLSFSKIASFSCPKHFGDSQVDYQLDLAYDVGATALDGSKVYRVYLPQAPGEALRMRLQVPNESHGNSWSCVNPVTGILIKTFDTSQASLATRVWSFKYKFHIGEFIGWPVKILWLLFSLLPIFFIVTGCYFFVKRKN